MALLKLTPNDVVCDDFYRNVDNTTGLDVSGDNRMVKGCKRGANCVSILCNAEIASFQPALSYGPARDLFQSLGLMNFDSTKRRWRCVRASEVCQAEPASTLMLMRNMLMCRVM